MINCNIGRIFILALAFTTLSCDSKTENTTTGNPMVSLAMTSSSQPPTVANHFHLIDLLIPKAFAYPPPASMVDSAGNTVVIDSIWANFGQIEFKPTELPDGSEVDGDNIEFSGQYIVNLTSGSPSNFVTGQIASPSIRRIKMKLVRAQTIPIDAPAGMIGKSIFISGTVNSHAFSYSTEDESVIEIAGPNLVTATTNSTVLIELQTANLIKRMDLSAITTTTHISDSNRVVATNPCANIEGSSTDLFTCFYKGIEKESNIGRDDDGDFQLDQEEDSVK